MLTERQLSDVSYRLSARIIRSLPDLLLGLLFAAAWLNAFNLGARHGVSLMLLVEIEAWIIIVTFMSAAFAYALTKDTEWTERAKDVILLVCRARQPVARDSGARRSVGGVSNCRLSRMVPRTGSVDSRRYPQPAEGGDLVR